MIEMLLGAGLVWTGMAIDSLRRRRPKQVKPICGCTHHLAMHDPKTGACHDQVQHRVNSVQQKPVQCSCKQYVGPITPELMLSTFQRELGS